ncbi:hypothetical protein LTR17_002919 [Elasticomyces elasticus]|nr:hypothetical protein LTR17_002919 [Elasticomyces elasticus]
MPGAVPTPCYPEDGRTPFYSDWDPNIKELPVLGFTISADRAEVDLSKTGDSPLYNPIHSRFTNGSLPPDFVILSDADAVLSRQAIVKTTAESSSSRE